MVSEFKALRWLPLLIFTLASGSEVVELTVENFEATMQETPHMLVMFHAPWCKHCQDFMPHFESAASRLQDRCVLAKVDAIANEALADQYHVEGYPTLQFFRDGRPEPVSGKDRTADDVVRWVLEALGPALREATSQALEEHLSQRHSQPCVVIRGTSSAKEIWQAVAEEHRPLAAFFFFEVAPEAAIIELHRGADEIIETRGEALSNADSAKEFFLDELLPLFGEINEDNYEGYLYIQAEGMVWGCFHPDTFREDTQRHTAAFSEAAKHFQRRLHFVFTDTREYEEHVKEALGCRQFPTIVLQKGDLNKEDELRRFKRLEAYEGEFLNSASIVQWLQQAMDGHVEEDDELDELDEDDALDAQEAIANLETERLRAEHDEQQQQQIEPSVVEPPREDL